MNSTHQNSTLRRSGHGATCELRKSIAIGAGSIALGALACLGTALWQARPQREIHGNTPDLSLPQNGLPEDPAAPPSKPSPNERPGNGSLPSLLSAEPANEIRQLVDRVVHWETTRSLAEQAPDWKQHVKELINRGPASVVAISEFLASNTNYDFGAAASEAIGYRSARAVLIDTLAQIGGAEAISALATVLRATADPQEIALLAQNLDKLEPSQHRQEVVDAARQALEVASGRKLETGDVAPLFEVLQKFGGSEVASDLQKAAKQWNYYATISLAQLPSGAGIPSLLQLAQDSNTTGSARDASLQMLAQLSDQSPEARTALLDLARQNAISRFTWRMVGPVLAGDQVSLLNSGFDSAPAEVNGLRTTSTSDNQHFFASPAVLTAEQANRRLALIDELLSATNDPFAREALQESRLSLSRRFSLASSSER